MTDKFKGWYPDYIENEKEREPILKLAKMMTGRAKKKLGLEKMTKYDPEYWGLALLCTDEQAEIALKMGVRQPKTLDQMVKVTGKDRGYLEKQLEEMAAVALVEYNWENPQHEKQYVLPIFVPGSAEFSCMNAKMLEKHPELGLFFERMSRIALEGLAPFMPEGGVGMHVIPVEKAISTENQSLPIEHISHWLEKYEGKYAASPCSCRRSRKTFDEGCADDPEEWCIAVGDMADYIVETNKGGHYITKERALEILKQAEDNGFVHQITNIDGENKIFAICNCNVNVCYALRTSQLFNTPNMDRSAYVAKVETENCVACGRCVEYCPAGAVKLGQKLCKKDGSQVEYPKHVLPTEKKWGPEMWDEDYRDKNRINCYDTGTAPCKTGLDNNYGAQIGKTLMHVWGKSVTTRACARAAAGSDARMGGCSMPVVINSGSGNQGMTVSLPVIVFADEWEVSHEKLCRSLVVSNLIAIHQKYYIGSLSAYCGAVSAACGAGAGITYMYGGTYQQVSLTIINTLGNIGGIVCDGAKPSCAAKIATSVDAALMAFQLSIQNKSFLPGEGIIKDDIEETIKSMGYIGRVGMRATDTEILNVMIDRADINEEC